MRHKYSSISTWDYVAVTYIDVNMRVIIQLYSHNLAGVNFISDHVARYLNVGRARAAIHAGAYCLKHIKKQLKIEKLFRQTPSLIYQCYKRTIT